jgi:CheY-like chemotaxis protein
MTGMAPFNRRSLWHPRVLVADDNQVCQIAAKGLLEQLGFTVDVARDGREAIKMSASWPYVAIFMDCGMPEVDGYRAAREIQERDRRSSRTLVIATTAHSRWVCMAAGMDHHMAKPLRLQTLAADCISLGLLPRPDVTLSAPPEALALHTPLLRPPTDLVIARDSLRAAEVAAKFIASAPSRLPELWRAGNAGDLEAIRRIASELKERAASVGAARVADLCDRMSKAAGDGRSALAVGIEPQLRQALMDTAAAIRSRFDADFIDPRAVDAALPDGSQRGSDPADPEPRPAVRVAIADDDPLALAAIETMIKRADRLRLVGVAADVEGIVDLVLVKRPDVVVLDWMMPGGGGPEAARRILNRCPETRVVGLSASDSADVRLDMTGAGASELLVKGGPADELTDMIRRAVEASG